MKCIYHKIISHYIFKVVFQQKSYHKKSCLFGVGTKELKTKELKDKRAKDKRAKDIRANIQKS